MATNVANAKLTDITLNLIDTPFMVVTPQITLTQTKLSDFIKMVRSLISNSPAMPTLSKIRLTMKAILTGFDMFSPVSKLIRGGIQYNAVRSVNTIKSFSIFVLIFKFVDGSLECLHDSKYFPRGGRHRFAQ